MGAVRVHSLARRQHPVSARQGRLPCAGDATVTRHEHAVKRARREWNAAEGATETHPRCLRGLCYADCTGGESGRGCRVSCGFLPCLRAVAHPLLPLSLSSPSSCRRPSFANAPSSAGTPSHVTVRCLDEETRVRHPHVENILYRCVCCDNPRGGPEPSRIDKRRARPPSASWPT